MTGWDTERVASRSARATIAMALLALLLVAAVPLAMLAGVVIMVLGHVIAGLAVFGGSVLAAALVVVLAGMSGMRQLRKLVSGRGFGVVGQDGAQHADPEAAGSDYANAVRLDRSEYTDVP